MPRHLRRFTLALLVLIALVAQSGSAQINNPAAPSNPVVQTTTSTGTVNDFALTTSAAVLRLNNATALTLTGISAGVDGQVVDLVAVGAGDIAFNNENAGSAAANRIITGNALTLNLTAGTGRVRLVYDGTTTRWRVTYTNATQVQIICRSTGDVANSGTSETDLKTCALPAALLARTGDSVRVRVWGTAANNGNSKTYRLYFGATVIMTFNTSATNQVWEDIGEISRTGAATQIAVGFQNQPISGYQGFASTTPAETLSGAVTVKMTGQSGTGSSDITAKNMSVEFVPAP